MAYAIRIDNVVVSGNQVSVQFTKGNTPLPATWQGEGWTFDKPTMLQQGPRFAEEVQNMLLPFLLLQWARLSGTLSPAQIIGKTIVLELSSLTNCLSVA